MTKRNFILLIIVLVIIVIVIFAVLFFRPNTNTPTNNGGGGLNFISQFNPFSQNTTNNTPPDNNNGENTPPDNNNTDGDVQSTNLIKVSSMPVAGFSVYQKERYKEVPVVTPDPTIPVPPTTTKTTKPTPPPTEIVPAIRYIARTNGNIFETFADKIEERQFSTTIIPKIYEAFFGSKAESVITRNLKGDDRTITTFAGNLPKELLGGDTTSNNEIKGAFLPENINDMSVSPDGSKIFYLLNVGNDAVGVTAGLLGDKKIQIFDSPFTEWLSSWPNAKMITLTTKPSYAVPGYMYAVNPDKKDFLRVIGGINGLTTLTSPDGKQVLYGDNNLALSIYNITTGATTNLPIKTMPEKCVWNKTSTTIFCAVPKSTGSALYPDDWYQGEVSFSDDIWKIDAQAGSGSLILDPTSAVGGESIDGIKLSVDDGENYLLLVNKKDSYLWEVKLK